MNALQSARFVRFKRVAGFGQSRSADMQPAAPARKATKAQQLFAELGGTADIEAAGEPASVLGLLGRADKAQQFGAGGYHGSTVDRGALRIRLGNTLRDIRKAARVISKARGVENVMGHFVLPVQRTDRLLATKGRAFADAAEPMRAMFVELDFAPDFIEALRADVEAFENARDTQNAGLQEQAGADAAINTQVARGLLIVWQLDVLMRNKYKDQPAVLAAWRSASRAEKPVRGRVKPLGGTALPALPVAPLEPEAAAGNAESIADAAPLVVIPMRPVLTV